MVKKTTAKKQRLPKKKAVIRTRTTVVRRNNGLDEGARKHVRLLLDPCNAPLCRPAYENTSGGLLIRYKRVLEFGTGAGQTAVALAFLPGENAIHHRTTATASTAGTWYALDAFSGLDISAGASTLSYRAVAGCVRIMSLASELNRSGIICAGSVESDVVLPTDATQTTTVTELQGVLPISMRMPDKAMEVIWRPGTFADAYYTGPIDPAVRSGIHGNACVAAISGLPAGIGIRVEFTGVYEVRPANSSNVVAVLEPPPSQNTWNQTLRAFMEAVGTAVRVEGGQIATAGASYLGQKLARQMARLEL